MMKWSVGIRERRIELINFKLIKTILPISHPFLSSSLPNLTAFSLSSI